MDIYYDNPDYLEAEMAFRESNLLHSAQAFVEDGFSRGLSPAEVLAEAADIDAPEIMARVESLLNEEG